MGQSVSLIGTWMQRTAVYWLIYMQTHSAFMLGLAVFATQFPSFLFSPLGGVLSDKYNRYRVLLATQSASLVQASILVVLVIFTKWNVGELFGLSVMLGIINAIDVPARQSLVHQMVEKKEDLPNAIALNSSMANLARLVGPAVSGIVLQTLGAGVCFIVNALSFVVVITTILLMRFPEFVQKKETKNVINEFKEGWKYMRQTPSIGNVVLLLALASLLALPFVTLLPVYAKVIFKGNATTFGYLNSAIGFGAMGSAFFLASLKAGVNLKRILFFSLLVFGSALILFSHITVLPVALFFGVLCGFGLLSMTTVTNTIIQTSASAEMRGRMISYFAMAYFGMLPLGGLLVGAISEYIGAPDTLLGEGIAAVLIALVFFRFLRKDVLKEKDKMDLIELEDQGIH